MMMIIVMASPSGPSWPPTRGASIPRAHGNWRWVHHTHTHKHTTRFYWINIVVLSLSLSPGTLQFASNASWPSGRMVSGSAWHQGGTLSHTLPLLTPLQAGHCEEGARGQKDEVNSQRKSERRDGEERGRGAWDIVHRAARILSLNVLAVFCLAEWRDWLTNWLEFRSFYNFKIELKVRIFVSFSLIFKGVLKCAQITF